MTAMRQPIAWLLLFGLSAAACGGESRIAADLEVPDRREARVTITPALEVSMLPDATLAERIVIEDIAINLSEVRLLGADPRIPAGGLVLLRDDRVVTADRDGAAGLELPFPEEFARQEDLAVYLRIDPAEALESASVVVRARIYPAPIEGGSSPLTAATDPDVDPALPPADGEDGATDPDVDPARCATDPDVDPARCGGRARRGLVQRGAEQPSLAFELRDDSTADLVTAMDRHSRLDVVLGIPASRWFTPAVVEALDRALAEEISASSTRTTSQRSEDRVVLERGSDPERGQHDPEQMPASGGEDYFLADGEDVDRLTIRRGE